jgi:hypothetical protein
VLAGVGEVQDGLLVMDGFAGGGAMEGDAE